MLLTTLIILLGLLALAIPVAASMGLLGLILEGFYSELPLSLAMGEVAWSTSKDFLLFAIPMFILLGEILLRAGIADRMYLAMVKWLSWLPGGLMHSNVGACAIFSATSGSSVATAATVGTVAIPLVRRHKYNESLFLGSLAAGGTLGILIPPSINIIIYAVLTDTSIPRLYLAAIIPCLILTSLFSLVIAIACILRPNWGGIPIEPASIRQKIATLPDLLPPLFIFLVVVGSIYVGVATPTEAAALGVMAALVLAAFYGKLSWAMLTNAIENAMRTTAMLMLIVVAAYFLNFIITGIGLTQILTDAVVSLELSKYEMLLAVVVFYLIVGCFMETLSLMITTVPVIAPIMMAIGFDPIWFGIVTILLIEIALITPPVGLNLYVVQSLRTSGGRIEDVMIGSLPFVVVMLMLISILAFLPQLVGWLPALVLD